MSIEQQSPDQRVGEPQQPETRFCQRVGDGFAWTAGLARSRVCKILQWRWSRMV